MFSQKEFLNLLRQTLNNQNNGQNYFQGGHSYNPSGFFNDTATTEIYTMVGVTPAEACSLSLSCWWVVEAGWITRVLASPTLAR